MDADAIMAKQLRQMEKERREKEMKLKSQEKKVWNYESHITHTILLAVVDLLVGNSKLEQLENLLRPRQG